MITFNKLGNYGRLGNQMFQYATLFSIANRKGYDFGIPMQNKSNDEYKNLSLNDCFENLSAKDSTNYSPKFKAMEHNFCYNPGIFGILDDTDICGYFQSEKYFENYREELLKEFCFKKEIYQKALDIRSITKKEVISLHIRLGDYVNQQHNHPVCSIEYYKEALNKLPDDLLIYIFSDDIEISKKMFLNLKRPILFVENTSSYIDMCLMTMCDYHILANSSFSWWGSWLSNSKKTIAPSKWFGDSQNMPKNWSDIYCKKWEII